MPPNIITNRKQQQQQQQQKQLQQLHGCVLPKAKWQIIIKIDLLEHLN